MKKPVAIRRYGVLVLLCAVFAAACLCAPGVRAADDAKDMEQAEERFFHVGLIQEGYIPDGTQEAADDTAGAGTFRLRLARKSASIEDYLYQQLSAHNEEINVSSYSLSWDSISSTYQRVVDAHPELFFVTGGCGGSLDGEGHTKLLRPVYRYTKSEAEAMQGKFDGYVAEILAGVDPSWSDVEKVLYLNDYLASYYTYDYTYTIRDAYTFFDQKTGVCQGYTLAMRVLMNELGIPSSYATSEDMNHIWNVVRIGGNWYHVDVTWDDPSTNAKQEVVGRAMHTNLLRSDAGITSTGHSGWVITENYTCGSTTYDNYFWQTISTPFVNLNGTWYFMQDGVIKTWTPGGETTHVEKDTECGKWSAGGSSYWIGCYAGLASYSGCLLYNTPSKIMLYDPETGLTQEVAEPDISPNEIYYLRVAGNTLTYNSSSTPNDIAAYGSLELTPIVPPSYAATVDTAPITTAYDATGTQIRVTVREDDAPAAGTAVITYKAGNAAAVVSGSLALVNGVATVPVEITGAMKGTTTTVAVTNVDFTPEGGNSIELTPAANNAVKITVPGYKATVDTTAITTAYDAGEAAIKVTIGNMPSNAAAPTGTAVVTYQVGDSAEKTSGELSLVEGVVTVPVAITEAMKGAVTTVTVSKVVFTPTGGSSAVTTDLTSGNAVKVTVPQYTATVALNKTTANVNGKVKFKVTVALAPNTLTAVSGTTVISYKVDGGAAQSIEITDTKTGTEALSAEINGLTAEAGQRKIQITGVTFTPKNGGAVQIANSTLLALTVENIPTVNVAVETYSAATLAKAGIEIEDYDAKTGTVTVAAESGGITVISEKACVVLISDGVDGYTEIGYTVVEGNAHTFAISDFDKVWIYLKGDVNFDGKVDFLNDTISIANSTLSTGATPLAWKFGTYVADVNHDGKVDFLRDTIDVANSTLSTGAKALKWTQSK